MSIRNRTTKLIARRHDLNYFKRMSPLRAWQWYLALAALVCAVVWFSATTLTRGNTAFSSGPMSSSHAVFGQHCELCHVPVIRATRWTPSFGRRNHVPDSACLSCHAAAPHHPAETATTPTCGSCHTEHVGAMRLASTADRGCTECHANLESRTGTLTVAAHIQSFAAGHPEFRPLRTASPAERSAALALRFTHAEHMKPGLSSPTGPVTLECQTCHAPVIDAHGRQSPGLAPVSFEKSCRSCHSLEFDTHIGPQAPHATPDIVQSFVVQSVAAFAQSHPEVVAAEIRNWPPEQLLPGQLRMTPPRNPQQWIATRQLRAEIILWRGRCQLCHRDLNRTSSPTFTPTLASGALNVPVLASTDSIALPRIELSSQPARWFQSAVFSHPAHQAVACTECHAALTSHDGSDILMPSISTCRRCHDGATGPQGPPVQTGHAESGCFLCHLYHGPAPPSLDAAHKLAELTSR